MNRSADETAVIARLRAAIRHEVEQKQIPAFSIAIVEGDRVVWADGFGHADAEKKSPATAETVYRVGSISKLLTDIAIMQQVEQGRLDLDEPVQTYLPDFAPEDPYGEPITLRQLMSHRSGLVREPPVGNFYDSSEPSLSETVASLNDTLLMYKPETATRYSNAGVAVLGAVLEQQLGVSHPEQVRRSILAPLEMTRSSFDPLPIAADQTATGWMWTYDGRRFEAPRFQLGTGPAGNLFSTVVDLAKFLTCLLNDGKGPDGPILQPETLALMAQPLTGPDGKPEQFGLGFHVTELDGETRIGHNGAVYGFSSELAALPDRNLGVATVAALDGSNGLVTELSDYALRLMIAAQEGKPLPTYRTTQPAPPEWAAQLIGRYKEVDGDGFAHIFELNGDLFLRWGPFQFTLRVAADDGSIIIDDTFGVDATVTLERGERLQIRDKVYRRLPDEPPADTPPRWKGLIGEYGPDYSTTYILEENGQLHVLLEWFYYYPLTEVSDDVFAFPDWGMYPGEQIIFKRDESGRATQMIMASVPFQRREVGTRDGETFRITPVKPIDDLRDEARSASPPPEPGNYRDPELTELVELDDTIYLDIRYATTNNFTGAVFYRQPRAFMQKPAAEAVARAHQRLKERGLGLLIHDAYRPWYVTKMFWDATPAELRDFVANPAYGSRHNRGCAVDLTLCDLETGKPIGMVAGYDEFSPRSFALYPGGTSRQRWYRELLRRTMEAEGFSIYTLEWWHFDYKDWKKYRIGNVTFEEIEEQ
ncbi:D-alanyl-D-alanine dipeptidase [Maioricimonas rarisocia]|uniref:D-alanyl-D-alanine dipeptidase n=1 Tax=Maioricimonas rarisocia TaxID=2528026 RepID=A0A517ZEB6_9PLAN|nr:serine hydrolase [Maioricimonas rarisocia]QDU40804.1 D-alanyl-D-alanine dipeptidase [Maioricimonas rarisocia]